MDLADRLANVERHHARRPDPVGHAARVRGANHHRRALPIDLRDLPRAPAEPERQRPFLFVVSLNESRLDVPDLIATVHHVISPSVFEKHKLASDLGVELLLLLPVLPERRVYFPDSLFEPFYHVLPILVFERFIEHARKLRFNVKFKTNAVLIREKQAKRLRELNVEQVQISVYSHRAEVHDGISKVPGSLKRTINGIRLLKSQGLKVTIANVLMKGNLQDAEGVRQLAVEVGAHYTLDPTITPMMNGDTSLLRLRISSDSLRTVFQNPDLVGNVEEFCAPPPPVDEDALEGYPCSAGHTACYVSPRGDVYPCVQFPITCGNVREQEFLDIWQNSPQLKEVRAIRGKHLTTCSSCNHLGTCTRCPGLAYMEGNMRGPSTQDCEKSFARTGIPSANLLSKKEKSSPARLVQIQLVPAMTGSRLSGVVTALAS